MQVPIYLDPTSNDYAIAKINSKYFFISVNLSNLKYWISRSALDIGFGTTDTSFLGPYLCTVDSDNLPDLQSLYPELFI